jgi:hypothetical protein
MLGTATVLGLFGALATAADPPPAAPRPFTANQRAQLLLLTPRQLFNRVDANKDGKISREELKDFAMRLVPGMVREKPEMPDRVFDRADKDGDGYLSFAEFKAMVARLRQRAGQGGKKAPERVEGRVPPPA